MTRAQLEHLVRAACAIADDDELIIVGSQSVLAQFPDAPAELLVSAEADVFPKNKPERAELIEGSIGELSQFHETFGYYADGVEEASLTVPSGWRERLVALRGPGTAGKTGWALEIHDLLIAKYVANREKDRLFNRVALRRGMADPRILEQRLGATRIDNETRARIAAEIRSDARETEA